MGKKSQVCTTANRVSNERRRNWERWWCSLRQLGTTRGPTILTAICTTSVAPAEPHHDRTRPSLKPKCRHCVAANPPGRCDTLRVTNPWVCAGVSAKHRTKLAPPSHHLDTHLSALSGPEAPVSLSCKARSSTLHSLPTGPRLSRLLFDSPVATPPASLPREYVSAIGLYRYSPSLILHSPGPYSGTYDNGHMGSKPQFESHRRTVVMPLAA